jgi:hypothetical protein
MPTWTQVQIDEIKAKILSAKSTAYADKSETNHDLSALSALLQQMENDNAAAAASSGGARTTFASFSRD